MNPEAICRLLAEPERLRTYAAVVLGAATPSDVAAASGLGARDVVRALATLTDRGLVTESGGRLSADLSLFKTAVRDNLVLAELVRLDPDAERDAVLRAFIADGRLVSIPTARGKRKACWSTWPPASSRAYGTRSARSTRSCAPGTTITPRSGGIWWTRT